MIEMVVLQMVRAKNGNQKTMLEASELQLRVFRSTVRQDQTRILPLPTSYHRATSKSTV